MLRWILCLWLVAPAESFVTEAIAAGLGLATETIGIGTSIDCHVHGKRPSEECNSMSQTTSAIGNIDDSVQTLTRECDTSDFNNAFNCGLEKFGAGAQLLSGGVNLATAIPRAAVGLPPLQNIADGSSYWQADQGKVFTCLLHRDDEYKDLDVYPDGSKGHGVTITSLPERYPLYGEISFCTACDAGKELFRQTDSTYETTLPEFFWSIYTHKEQKQSGSAMIYRRAIVHLLSEYADITFDLGRASEPSSRGDKELDKAFEQYHPTIHVCFPKHIFEELQMDVSTSSFARVMDLVDAIHENKLMDYTRDQTIQYLTNGINKNEWNVPPSHVAAVVMNLGNLRAKCSFCKTCTPGKYKSEDWSDTGEYPALMCGDANGCASVVFKKALHIGVSYKLGKGKSSKGNYATKSAIASADFLNSEWYVFTLNMLLPTIMYKVEDTCRLCPSGRYQNEEGQVECKECPGGKYHNISGSTSNTDCKVCPNGRQVRHECTTIYSENIDVQLDNRIIEETVCSPSKCETCGNGQFSSDGTPCRTCPEGFGTTNHIHCVECNPGKYHSNGQCVDCSDGEYQDNYKQTFCKYCPHGYGSIQNKTRCHKCTDGTFSDKGVCTSCPGGFYQDETGTNECKHCPRGYGDLPYKRACEECKPGRYEHNGMCSTCAYGQYQDQSKQRSCLSCISNASLDNRKSCFPCLYGTDASDDCSPCGTRKASKTTCGRDVGAHRGIDLETNYAKHRYIITSTKKTFEKCKKQIDKDNLLLNLTTAAEFEQWKEISCNRVADGYEYYNIYKDNTDRKKGVVNNKLIDCPVDTFTTATDDFQTCKACENHVNTYIGSNDNCSINKNPFYYVQNLTRYPCEQGTFRIGHSNQCTYCPTHYTFLRIKNDVFFDGTNYEGEAECVDIKQISKHYAVGQYSRLTVCDPGHIRKNLAYSVDDRPISACIESGYDTINTDYSKEVYRGYIQTCPDRWSSQYTHGWSCESCNIRGMYWDGSCTNNTDDTKGINSKSELVSCLEGETSHPSNGHGIPHMYDTCAPYEYTFDNDVDKDGVRDTDVMTYLKGYPDCSIMLEEGSPREGPYSLIGNSIYFNDVKVFRSYLQELTWHEEYLDVTDISHYKDDQYIVVTEGDIRMITLEEHRITEMFSIEHDPSYISAHIADESLWIGTDEGKIYKYDKWHYTINGTGHSTRKHNVSYDQAAYIRMYDQLYVGTGHLYVQGTKQSVCGDKPRPFGRFIWTLKGYISIDKTIVTEMNKNHVASRYQVFDTNLDCDQKGWDEDRLAWVCMNEEDMYSNSTHLLPCPHPIHCPNTNYSEDKHGPCLDGLTSRYTNGMSCEPCNALQVLDGTYCKDLSDPTKECTGCPLVIDKTRHQSWRTCDETFFGTEDGTVCDKGHTAYPGGTTCVPCDGYAQYIDTIGRCLENRDEDYEVIDHLRRSCPPGYSSRRTGFQTCVPHVDCAATYSIDYACKYEDLSTPCGHKDVTFVNRDNDRYICV